MPLYIHNLLLDSQQYNIGMLKQEQEGNSSLSGIDKNFIVPQRLNNFNFQYCNGQTAIEFIERPTQQQV